IHFWATWCPACSMEASNIQTISEHYEVLTFAVKSDKNEIGKYMKENTLNFNVINDKSGFIAHKFKISVYPTTFIYDKDKNLVFSEVGYTSTWGLWLRMWWAGL
ncbi:MAG: redoxin domain-containing protein, partial [Campylobacterota bacterium]|nr:redoxin domain-containing protein [Campylobacterota bacterium]